jgi:hypothetical protein
VAQHVDNRIPGASTEPRSGGCGGLARLAERLVAEAGRVTQPLKSATRFTGGKLLGSTPERTRLLLDDLHASREHRPEATGGALVTAGAFGRGALQGSRAALTSR